MSEIQILRNSVDFQVSLGRVRTIVPLFATKVPFLWWLRTSIPLFIENSANGSRNEPNKEFNVR